jgi:hypothetical protein
MWLQYMWDMSQMERICKACEARDCKDRVKQKTISEVSDGKDR